MEAPKKNKLWVRTTLPAQKKVVSCKWIYIVNKNPEGKVQLYKSRLVAGGYSQTYGNDYDEDVCSSGKDEHGKDIGFLCCKHLVEVASTKCQECLLARSHAVRGIHGDTTRFGTSLTTGKICRLMKSLYGLKQSPRAWFDKFKMCCLWHGVWSM